MASRRGYATVAEVESLVSGITSGVTDNQISEAEELIDAYIGYQDKFIGIFYRVQATQGSTDSVITDFGGFDQLYRINDYFKGCQIECIGGGAAGQIGLIASSEQNSRSVTLVTPFTGVAVGDQFKVYQLGKLPRCGDVVLNYGSTQYFKSIPEQVRRAVCYQVEFMLTQGEGYFNGDQVDMSSESIGNYSYVKGDRGSGAPSAIVNMVAPKARAILKGIKNSTGRLSTGDQPDSNPPYIPGH